ncbi:putative pentatricopeptide repeat-containing protein At1g56570 [Oryza brachyantha]|uniref:putative pentatricopeptide repeat-containing protein At1g56570 n=1 Tax=Oryza brachyantha TaxID=4533 RepID=UPI0007762B23|nr:putative pentatricopeptide repeat-containing protein At1g56570 [Oryza brachyantha]
MFEPCAARPLLRVPATLRHFHTAACHHHRQRQEPLPGYNFYAALLQRSAATSDPRLAVALHAAFLKQGLLSSHIFLCNHLLIACFHSRLDRHGLRLLDEMPRRNAVSWTAAITGLIRGGRPREALALFMRMRRAGVPPNEFTLVSALQASSFVVGTGVGRARQMYALAIRTGFDSNVFLTNAFLAAMVRHGHLADAVQLFVSANARDIVSWNTLLAGFARYSCVHLCNLWRWMAIEGVSADGFSFSTVLSGLARSANIVTGLQVHAQLVKSVFINDVSVSDSLLEMYMKNKELESGTRAFAEICHRDVVSWTELAAGLLHCGEPAKSLRVVSDMMLDGIRPNNYTIATVANACANLASLNEARKLHGYVIKLGEDFNVSVNNALIDMYAKCRSVACAYKVFQLVQQRQVITWSAMIMAFAQNGLAKEAVQVFDDMLLEGIAPNHTAFVWVLRACSQGGFVDEGWIYFNAMADKFGVEPGEDHYACMVDLLRKAGRTGEAEEIISRMPFCPKVLV